MKKALCIVCFSILFTLAVFAAAPTFETGSFAVSESENINYWLFTPANATENMPLIVYLHGGSGKGNDINTLTANGFCMWVSEGRFDDTPAYILFPQLTTSYKGWPNNRTGVRDLITEIVRTCAIDRENISLVGHSMGGTGAYNLAAAYPSLFARVMPMSGSVTDTERNRTALSQMPLWAIVGSADTIVSPDTSIEFVAALQETGADAQITILEGATHFDVPERAFLDEDLDIVGWLIGRESEPEPEPQTYTLLDALQVLYRMLSGETAAACDPNGDGALDLRDVLWILKRIAA